MKNRQETLLSCCQQLLEIPTAPYQEEWMIGALHKILEGIPGISFEMDAWGNTSIYLRKELLDEGVPPLVFVTHLDHPGFVFPDSQKGKLIEGYFEGRVFDEYFDGSKVRLFRHAHDSGVLGKVLKFSDRQGDDDHRHVTIELEEEIENPVLGMWDVSAFESDGEFIRGRACDDLCGVGATLAALSELVQIQAQLTQPIIMLYSRAEETGFCGSLCHIDEQVLPENSKIVSVEISGETDFARLGNGAILRVGDKAGMFNHDIVNCFWDGLLSPDSENSLKVYRAFMDRGTCEATAFLTLGFEALGICAPVRNYHNMNFESKIIDAEAVSISDLMNLTGLIVEMSTAPLSEDINPALKHRMELLLQRGRRNIKPLVIDAISNNKNGLKGEHL